MGDAFLFMPHHIIPEDRLSTHLPDKTLEMPEGCRYPNKKPERKGEKCNQQEAFAIHHGVQLDNKPTVRPWACLPHNEPDKKSYLLRLKLRLKVLSIVPPAPYFHLV
jgi:hypothetical protein